MKKIALIIMGSLFLFLAQGQDTAVLTLDYCLQQAVIRYPLHKQLEMIDQSSNLRTKNLSKNYYPNLNLNGQASYQSDVTQVPIEAFIGIPSISKDWYKITLDLTQVIWDGGSTHQNKNLEEVDKQIDKQNLEIELYQLKEQVTKAYFSVLLLQQNRQLLDTHLDDLKNRLKQIESSVKNGTTLQTNADIINAEIMEVEQNQAEILISISTGIATLSELISEPLPAGIQLQLPVPQVTLPADAKQRLEYQLFETQKTQFEAIKKLTSTKNMPRFSAFGQGGYGRPGLDMLNNDFMPWYYVGINFTWNFWSWNKPKTENDILDINKQMLLTREETFNKTVNIEMQNKLADIRKYETLIQKDGEIVALRTRIAENSAYQLDQGVITATDYITELNAETEARLNLEFHRIQLVNAKYEYLLSAGRL